MSQFESHIWSGEKKERAISSADLKMRLEMNKRYQDRDFSAWLRSRLAVRSGENILDVGCGTGAQAFFMLEDAGRTGSVVALDISHESVQSLNKDASSRGYTNLKAFQLDMGELKDKLMKDFESSRFTLAHSSYAIYYSPRRIDVLAEMQARLTSDGRLAIFTPCEPHGMVELASKFHQIPQPVIDSLKFGTEQLIPLFREAFWNVEIHFFQSELNITSAEDFLAFYQATTYYDKNSEEAIVDSVAESINKLGYFKVKKNGILLLGNSKRAGIQECASYLGIR
jgi:ubiquinone/menaquinone biosynthesis C-methylase UbiE